MSPKLRNLLSHGLDLLVGMSLGMIVAAVYLFALKSCQ
jgi:hypothetical protein